MSYCAVRGRTVQSNNFIAFFETNRVSKGAQKKVNIMKNFFCGVLFFFGALVFCSAAGIAEEARRGNEKADMSYAFGMIIASDLAETGLDFNYDAFIRGFRETMENEPTQFTLDEAMKKINTAFVAAQAEIGERNRALGLAFLAENGNRPEVTVTPSGLQYEVIQEGEGEIPGAVDVVLVHYMGATIDGTVFDNTYESGRPIEIPLDRVIPGWSEGLRLMKEGGRSILYVPPDLAYGESGTGGTIGPNSVLVFDVELFAIVRPPTEEEDTTDE